MSKLKEFVSVVHSIDDILDEYRNMRQIMQREGYTESQISRLYSFPYDLMASRNKLQEKISDFKSSLQMYGIFEEKEYQKFIESKLKEIDLEYPLSEDY